ITVLRARSSVMLSCAETEEIAEIEAEITVPATGALVPAISLMSSLPPGLAVSAGSRTILLPFLFLFLPCPIFFRILEHIIRFVYFIHLPGSFRIIRMQVGVVFLCLFPVCLFYLILRCSRRYAKHFIGIDHTVSSSVTFS